MSALFKADRSVMSEEEFKIVYTEYVDTAGLFASEEFSKVSYIHYLNNRINSVKLAIKLQKDFIDNFDIAYIDGLPFFKKFGHTIYWNDKISFLKALDKIEKKEFKYISQLEKNYKELTESRIKKNRKEKTVEQTRGSFIRTLNSLGKIGYKIQQDITTVEELAWMIKQQSEEVK